MLNEIFFKLCKISNQWNFKKILHYKVKIFEQSDKWKIMEKSTFFKQGLESPGIIFWGA